MDTDRAAAAIAALAHHVRLDVWRLLLPHGSLGLSAGTIAVRLAIAPSSLSFHLLQMTHGRVLVQRRFSRQIIYAINEEVVGLLFSFLSPGGRSSGLWLVYPPAKRTTSSATDKLSATLWAS